jgi:NAD(P)-dependent dehydrogenase (short-subunit alcohol dehydrogenase family)
VTALAGRVALVTGASRGIGAAAALALHAAGARIVRVARSLSDTESASRLDARADLTDPAQVDALASRVIGSWGAPDILVNNAGGFLLASLDRTTPEAFEGQLAANLRAPFLVARAFLPAMRARGGHLITIGSIADHRAFPENAAYAAAKYGLRGLHEVLREEYRGTGVRCTLLSPGPTDTDLWDPVDPDNRPGFTPRRAMLRPDDVAQAILWVATRPGHVDLESLRIGPVA